MVSEAKSNVNEFMCVCVYVCEYVFVLVLVCIYAGIYVSVLNSVWLVVFGFILHIQYITRLIYILLDWILLILEILIVVVI